MNVLRNSSSSTFLKSCILHAASMFAGRPLEWLGGIYQVQIHLTEKQNSSVILTSCGRRVKERERQQRGKLSVRGEHKGGRWGTFRAGDRLYSSGICMGRSVASCLGADGVLAPALPTLPHWCHRTRPTCKILRLQHGASKQPWSCLRASRCLWTSVVHASWTGRRAFLMGLSSAFITSLVPPLGICA